MKKVGLVFIYIGLSISIILGLIFAFIEFRSLFAGDFQLFNEPAKGLFTYLFRGLFFLGIIALSVSIIIFVIKKKESYLPLFLIGTGLLISSLFTVAFYAWFVALVIIVVTFIPTLITFILMRRH